MMTEHAHIAKTRIGYTVHRTGLFFPEKATTWHPTLSRAIRAAERWGGTITVPQGGGPPDRQICRGPNTQALDLLS